MELNGSRTRGTDVRARQQSSRRSFECAGLIVKQKSPRRNFWLAAMAFMALVFGSDAAAICELGPQAPPVDFGVIEAEFPAEGARGFVPISSWVEFEWAVADCPGDNPDTPHDLYLALRQPLEKLGQYSDGGKTYTVIASGWESLGFVVEHSKSYSEELFPISNGLPNHSLGAVPGPNLLKVRVRLGLYKRPRWPEFTASPAMFEVKRPGDFVSKGASFQVRVKQLQKTCSVMPGNELSFAVPSASVEQFGGVGSTVDGRGFQISMHCDPGIRVFATFTDATLPGNRSAVLSLGSGSTAQGVGYQILRDGDIPIAFGPDSTEVGTENQFAVTDAPIGGDVDLPLKIRYFQTDPAIVPGSANAVATITFAYQ
jgi:type 1 fimbria pilin